MQTRQNSGHLGIVIRPLGVVITIPGCLFGYHSYSFFAPITAEPSLVAIHYNSLIGTMTTRDANRIWGTTLVSAVAYAETNAPRETTHVVITRVARLRIEYTIRKSGRILGRCSYAFKQDGHEIEHKWKDIGWIDPFTGITILEVEQFWDALGYMVTRRVTSGKFQAEMALAMIANLGRR